MDTTIFFCIEKKTFCPCILPKSDKECLITLHFVKVDFLQMYMYLPDTLAPVDTPCCQVCGQLNKVC